MLEALADIRITDVLAHPLTQTLAKPSVTSWGTYERVSCVLIEVRTDAGITGVGECLARFAPQANVEAVNSLYRGMLVGQTVFDIARHAGNMRRGMSGRAGGISAETISGIDIALWDIVGKVSGLPLYRLFGGVGRTELDAYASSVDWVDDVQTKEQIDALVARGFKAIKLKIGTPADQAVKRAAFARSVAGDGVSLYADANWAYTPAEDVRVGEALQASGFGWFEEPVMPEDIGGYRYLRSKLSIALAAGESDFNAHQSAALISERLIDVVQPNAARAGGISEVRRTLALAAVHNVGYAPHVGFSGIVCEAAGLHLAAAAENTLTVEVVVSRNPFREDLGTLAPASSSLSAGRAPVPQGPGLGVEIDWEAVARLRHAS